MYKPGVDLMVETLWVQFPGTTLILLTLKEWLGVPRLMQVKDKIYFVVF